MEKGKKKEKWIRARITLGLLFVAGLICAICQIIQPYALTIDGKDVLYVQDKEKLEAVVECVMKDYTAEGADIKSIETDEKLEMGQVPFWDRIDKKDILSKKEAIEKIETANQGQEDLFVATIVGQTETEEPYVPETNYVQDDTMFAGESRIEGDTTEGRQLVTRELTTVNGELTNTEITEEKILEKGSETTVYKGIRGLPEGEDWRTYEGDPLFNDANDLMDYSHKFVGVPYVKGGTSLETGVDCVGFVIAMYRYHGINLSSNLRKAGHAVSYSNAKAGDIICYSHHFALYLGDGMMIHAANPKKDVCIEKVHGGITGVRRIID